MTQPSFSVDDELLRNVASASGGFGFFCHQVHYALGNERPADVEESFGEYGVFGAYREFHQRWRAEVQMTEEAAEQFDFALVNSLGNYGHSDGNAVQRFGSR